VEYIFKHALTQDVAYHSLLAPRRKDLHRRTGQALEELFAERLGEFSGLIAFHYLRGEAWDKALAYLLRAGDDALGLYANAEARQHYTAALIALDHLPDDEENRRRRVDTTVKLVSVSFASEDPGRNLARLVAVEPLARALTLPDGAPDRLRLARVQFWMGRCHYYRNEQREAIGYYQAVLSVAQEFGDEVLLGGAASTIGRALVAQGRFQKARVLLEQSLPPLEKTGNWQDWVFSMAYRSLALAATGEYELGVAECKRAMAKALEIKYGTGFGVCHVLLSLVYLLGNDMPNMLGTAQQLTEIAEKAGDRMYVWAATGFQGWAQSRLGNLQAAMELLAKAEELKKTLGGRLVMADWLAAADAEVALRGGSAAVLTLAENAVAQGKAVDNTTSQGMAQRTWGQALALLTPPRWDDAEGHMAASLSVLEAGGALLEMARTHAAWGLILRQRGQTAAAREHFEKAAAQFALSGLSAELQGVQQWL
jgi:tetratricopeptide (TPR) repeat protein